MLRFKRNNKHTWKTFNLHYKEKFGSGNQNDIFFCMLKSLLQWMKKDRHQHPTLKTKN